MKKTKETIVKVITQIFGYGITISLFAGGLGFLGFLAALIIGGEQAGAICTFLNKQFYPVVFILGASMILLGLIKMYLCGESAFSAGKKKEKAKV